MQGLCSCLKQKHTCFILANSLRVCSSFLRSFLLPTRMMGTLGQKCFTSGVHFSGMFSVKFKAWKYSQNTVHTRLFPIRRGGGVSRKIMPTNIKRLLADGVVWAFWPKSAVFLEADIMLKMTMWNITLKHTVGENPTAEAFLKTLYSIRSDSFRGREHNVLNPKYMYFRCI